MSDSGKSCPSTVQFGPDGHLDKTPAAGTQEPEFTDQNMVRLAREGRNDQIRRIFCETYFQPLPVELVNAMESLECVCYDAPVRNRLEYEQDCTADCVRFQGASRDD